MSILDARLSHLPSHERALARGQLARAEAIVDLVESLAGAARKLAAAVSRRTGGCALRNSRQWPHAVGERAGASFPAIGLQH